MPNQRKSVAASSSQPLFWVEVPHPVRKSIQTIPLPWRQRIWQCIDSLEIDPWQGIKMTGRYADKRRIRVWPYRIVYRVDKKKREVVLSEVDHRGHVSYR